MKVGLQGKVMCDDNSIITITKRQKVKLHIQHENLSMNEFAYIYNTADWIQQKVTAIVLFQPIVMNELLPTTWFSINTSCMHSDLLHK